MEQRGCLLPGCTAEGAQSLYPNDGRDGVKVICPACGTYAMSRTFAATGAFERDRRSVEGLRVYIRKENQAGRVPYLQETNWQQLASANKPSAFSKLF